MADEQATYLISQDEELTNVRERLEHAPARAITLVIPSHTKLRSHVGWRVLHSRARELGKDVLVISPDRQIRAVAKAAGFRVAESLESPPSTASRFGSRTAASGTSRRPTSQSRGTAPRGTPESRIPRQRTMPSRRYGSRFEQPEQKTNEPTSSISSPATGTTPPSATFGQPDQSFDQDIEYLIDTSPSIRPVIPDHKDEEPDLLSEDFYQAQRIREAAQQGDDDSLPTPSDRRGIPDAKPHTFRSTYVPDEQEDDPFAYMEEYRPSPLPEQLGSAPVDEIDQGVHDISDVPTDILAHSQIENLPDAPTDMLAHSQIEDLGDQGDIVESNISWAPTSDMPMGDDDLEDAYEPKPLRNYGSRPRQNLSGSATRRPSENIDDEDTALPFPEQSPRNVTPARQSGSLSPAASTRGPNPIMPPKPREGTIQPVPTSTKKQPVKATTTGRRSVTAVPRSTRKPPPPPKHEGRRTAIVLVCILLFFALLGAFAYFVPSANVTITIPAQSFSVSSLKFTTASPGKQNAGIASVPAETLTYSTNFRGSGPVSGSRPDNTGQATGTVSFTNSGSQQIIIPSGVIISTSKGVQFLTDAEVAVPSNGTFPVVPIHAQLPGPSGNVPANSITVIPPPSLQTIQQNPANNGITISSSTLQVNNSNPTSGGGTGTTRVVSGQDITSLQKQLEQQVLTSKDFTDWLNKNVHAGDVRGNFPAPVDTLTTTPTEGQVAPDGKINGTLHYHLTLLVVRHTAIEAAARDQLNLHLAAQKQLHGYSLVPEQTLQLGPVTNTSPQDGKSVSFSLGQTTGLIAPIGSNSSLASLVAREPVDQARDEISNTLGLRNKQDVTISITPGFFPSMPFRADNIHINFKPVLAPAPQKGTPKKK